MVTRLHMMMRDTQVQDDFKSYSIQFGCMQFLGHTMAQAQ